MLSHLVYVVAKNIVTVQPSLPVGCAECAHIFIHSFIHPVQSWESVLNLSISEKGSILLMLLFLVYSVLPQY